jgi:hypothetical protein
MRANGLRRIRQTKEFAMKKLTLLIVFALGLGSVSAFAYDYRQENHTGYVAFGRGGLDSRVERLNRMLSHVRWELNRYRGNWRLRREVDRISTDVSRVNWRYRHGYDNGRLRSEIDSLRAELHNIEVRLHSREYYRWD